MAVVWSALARFGTGPLHTCAALPMRSGLPPALGPGVRSSLRPPSCWRAARHPGRPDAAPQASASTTRPAVAPLPQVLTLSELPSPLGGSAAWLARPTSPALRMPATATMCQRAPRWLSNISSTTSAPRVWPSTCLSRVKARTMRASRTPGFPSAVCSPEPTLLPAGLRRSHEHRPGRPRPDGGRRRGCRRLRPQCASCGSSRGCRGAASGPGW